MSKSKLQMRLEMRYELNLDGVVYAVRFCRADESRKWRWSARKATETAVFASGVVYGPDSPWAARTAISDDVVKAVDADQDRPIDPDRVREIMEDLERRALRDARNALRTNDMFLAGRAAGYTTAARFLRVELLKEDVR